jgi:hypothetical protein
MDDDQVDLLKTKIKMLKSRLTQMKSKTVKTDEDIKKEEIFEANIEHFTNELNEINKKSPHINRISKHINIRDTNDYKIFNKDSPVRKSPSKSPRSKQATKSILKKKGGSKRNITRKHKNRRN